MLLLIGRAMRLTLFLFVAQMVGTFLTFFVLPEVTFQDGNPLLLTVEGEFVVKNLVLVSAALVVGASVRRRREGSPEPGGWRPAIASGTVIGPPRGGSEGE
jgi:uncharacterized membrane protein YkgB